MKKIILILTLIISASTFADGGSLTDTQLLNLLRQCPVMSATLLVDGEKITDAVLVNGYVYLSNNEKDIIQKDGSRLPAPPIAVVKSEGGTYNCQ